MDEKKCPKCASTELRVYSAKSDLGYGETILVICKCGFKACYTFGRTKKR